MAGDGGGGGGEGEKPLRKIAEAFEGLAKTATSGPASGSAAPAPAPMEVAPFAQACSLVSVLFGCLGIAFKFAEMDYVAKVADILEASKSFSTLQSMIDLDVQQNSVRQGGSHSRNLLRVKRGIDMVKVLFEQILVTEGNSLKGPASVAYEKVFSQHHGWVIRKAVAAGLYALPTKAQLLRKLNEDEASARAHLETYIRTSGTIVLYIEELFNIRGLGIDW